MRLTKLSTQDVLPFAAVLLSALLARRVGFLLTLILASLLCFLVRTAASFKQLLASKKQRQHTFVLHSIRASHFSEKVRWALDKSGATYTEEADVAIIGAMLLGRTLPRLRIKPPDAPAYTVSGSANCVSALHAALMQDGTDPASIAWLQYTKGDAQLERQIDRVGRSLVVLFYSDTLSNKGPSSQQQGNNAFNKHVWGLQDTSLPPWQRWVAAALYPAMKAFVRLNNPAAKADRAMAAIQDNLQEIESKAAALSSAQCLGGSTPNRIDISLAAINSLWALDTKAKRAHFSAGNDHGAISAAPEVQAQAELSKNLAKKFPAVHSLCGRLYEQHRST